MAPRGLWVSALDTGVPGVLPGRQIVREAGVDVLLHWGCLVGPRGLPHSWGDFGWASFTRVPGHPHPLTYLVGLRL